MPSTAEARTTGGLAAWTRLVVREFWAPMDKVGFAIVTSLILIATSYVRYFLGDAVVTP